MSLYIWFLFCHLSLVNSPFTQTMTLTAFFPGDMLGGHLDDMEKDWSKPIVSIRYFASFVHFPCSFFLFLFLNWSWRNYLNGLILISPTSAWVARLFFFLGVSLGRTLHLQCSSGVVMLCLWLEKQGSVTMVSGVTYLILPNTLSYNLYLRFRFLVLLNNTVSDFETHDR